LIDEETKHVRWSSGDNHRWAIDRLLNARFDASAAPAYRLRISAIGYKPVVDVFACDAADATWEVALEPVEQLAAKGKEAVRPR
jgi:hypothetical protein